MCVYHVQVGKSGNVPNKQTNKHMTMMSNLKEKMVQMKRNSNFSHNLLSINLTNLDMNIRLKYKLEQHEFRQLRVTWCK